PTGQSVGVLAIDFETRRRVRVNGTLRTVTDTEMQVTVEQAYGNCPSYIQQRQVQTAYARPGVEPTPARYGHELEPPDVDLIERADTFFLGTTHPTRGADASHRGGLPGFVRIDGDRLWWPDYPGNNLFNSMGNIAVDPTAALLFIDFATGDSLRLSGRAQLDWATPGASGDDGGTGRRIHFTPTDVVAMGALPLHASDAVPSPRNPGLTG
ncbi:MAG: pyridoxamine 5'-phosphate oxidase family protein, partial [Actinomycetota bacterium]|nr:pyridoxamine 5'-phosphate oxidase family protein [Actinomycetota bacterium]